MFALRERRVHVTQEDFEMAVAKVMKKDTEKNMSLRKLWKWEAHLSLHGQRLHAETIEGLKRMAVHCWISCSEILKMFVKPVNVV